MYYNKLKTNQLTNKTTINMKSKVKVTKHPETGRVFTPFEVLGKDGKQYGSYRVEQKILNQSNGIDRVTSISAFRTISAEDFMKAQEFLFEGATLDGQIIVKESTEASYEGQLPKTAGEDGEVLTISGMPIYRSTEYTADMNASDVLIKHDNILASNKVEAPATADKLSD